MKVAIVVPDCPSVDSYMTVGSPLGLHDLQKQLEPEWSRRDGFPSARLHTDRWVNVYDPLDVVDMFGPYTADGAERDAWFQGDGHLTAAGNGVVAAELARALRERALIE